MHRAHKIRLMPTQEQAIYFAKSCGVARHAYNWALAQWKQQYEAGGKPSEMSLRKQYNAIKPTEFPWALEVTKNAPQQAIKNLGTAFQNFFRNVKQGKKPGYPKSKKKGVRDSFRADNGPQKAGENAVKVVDKTVKLPKVGTSRCARNCALTVKWCLLRSAAWLMGGTSRCWSTRQTTCPAHWEAALSV